MCLMELEVNRLTPDKNSKKSTEKHVFQYYKINIGILVLKEGSATRTSNVLL